MLTLAIIEAWRTQPATSFRVAAYLLCWWLLLICGITSFLSAKMLLISVMLASCVAVTTLAVHCYISFSDNWTFISPSFLSLLSCASQLWHRQGLVLTARLATVNYSCRLTKISSSPHSKHEVACIWGIDQQTS